MPREYRCEACLKLKTKTELKPFNGEPVCFAGKTSCLTFLRSQAAKKAAGKAEPPAKRAKPAVKAPLKKAKPGKKAGKKKRVRRDYRCENDNCLKKCTLDELFDCGGELFCKDCRKQTWGWYAVAVRGSDAKARTNIISQVKMTHQEHRLGRIIIPRTRKMRITKARWRMLDETGQPVMVQDPHDGRMVEAEVSDDDGEQAVWRAKQMWGDIHRIVDCVKTREGGFKVFEDRKAMPGYLLVQCEPDERVFAAVKRAKGVMTILPYTEPMTYEDTEDGPPSPVPTPVPVEQVRNVIEKPARKLPDVRYEIGDQVKFTTGPFKDIEATVRGFGGKGEDVVVKIEAEIMGMKSTWECAADVLTKLAK